MNDELWRQFAQTGRIADYLKYKEQEGRRRADISGVNVLGSYENNNQGACNQRANDGGE